jgi:hypothetical protein
MKDDKEREREREIERERTTAVHSVAWRVNRALNHLADGLDRNTGVVLSGVSPIHPNVDHDMAAAIESIDVDELDMVTLAICSERGGEWTQTTHPPIQPARHKHIS